MRHGRTLPDETSGRVRLFLVTSVVAAQQLRAPTGTGGVADGGAVEPFHSEDVEVQ